MEEEEGTHTAEKYRGMERDRYLKENNTVFWYTTQIFVLMSDILYYITKHFSKYKNT